MRNIFFLSAILAAFLFSATVILSQEAQHAGMGMSVSVQCIHKGIPYACGSTPPTSTTTTTTKTTTTTSTSPSKQSGKISSNYFVQSAVSVAQNGVSVTTTTTSSVPPASNPSSSPQSSGGGSAAPPSTSETTTTTPATSTTTETGTNPGNEIPSATTSATNSGNPTNLTGFFAFANPTVAAIGIGAIVLIVAGIVIYKKIISKKKSGR